MGVFVDIIHAHKHTRRREREHLSWDTLTLYELGFFRGCATPADGEARGAANHTR